MEPIDLNLIRNTLLAALREDIGSGDLTSRATIPANARAAGRFTTKEPLVVAGLPVIQEICRLVDSDLQFKAIILDGASVAAGAILAEVRGSARSILAAERTSLNLLQRMCGIATLTHQYAGRIAGTRARIVDTRKTAAGLRVLDKYAVSCGGGMNHRMGLFDGVLIKNNHLIFHPTIERAIQEARRNLGHLVKIEIEVRTLDELRSAVDAGADVILLDNFDPDLTRKAVGIVKGRIPLESSGGVTLETARSFAEAGVDYISVGALTHSAPAVDIHLRVAAE
ncbi:MAG: carboxylating nicotinate-nucleotide diphosphorylase [Acidobacteria bacterium]|nr:MAG: carboxylating nicotinate-nucleotide diphosphorylase [Acidobacteriota bacterium]